MAIKLGENDTKIVLAALHEYREAMVNARGDRSNPYIDGIIEGVDRLIGSYRRSLAAMTAEAPSHQLTGDKND